MNADDEIAAAVHRKRNIGAFAGAAGIFKPDGLTAAAGIVMRMVLFAIEQRHAHAVVAIAAVAHRREERTMRIAHFARSFRNELGPSPIYFYALR